MRSMWITTALIVLSACSPKPADRAPADEMSPPVLELINGLWFTGDGFQAKTMYAVGGVLRAEPPAGAISVIDLGGAYVVPPFGEAHTTDQVLPKELRKVRRSCSTTACTTS